MKDTDYNESEVRAFTKSSKIKHLENLRRAEEAQVMTEQQFNDQYGPDALNLAIEQGFDRNELLRNEHG